RSPWLFDHGSSREPGRGQAAGGPDRGHVYEYRSHADAYSDDGFSRDHGGNPVSDAATADEQKHAGGGDGRPLCAATENDALCAAVRVCVRRRRLPGGCVVLLDDVESLDVVPAVLRHLCHTRTGNTSVQDETVGKRQTGEECHRGTRRGSQAATATTTSATQESEPKSAQKVRRSKGWRSKVRRAKTCARGERERSKVR